MNRQQQIDNLEANGYTTKVWKGRLYVSLRGRQLGYLTEDDDGSTGTCSNVERSSNISADDIVRYHVRRPGCTAWSFHRSENAAHKGARKAEQVTGLHHSVYAEHRDGEMTGPLMMDDIGADA